MEDTLDKLKSVYGGDVTEIYSDVFNTGYYGLLVTLLAFAVFALFVMYQRNLNRAEVQRR
ncbi:uncharacterized protein LOC117584173 [Drosophila guanche]|uniref:uncharacterized protein LOC117584173 n=1 Tax=Drosophila guanche TaxID=7266 RepID=UPI00147087A1|nr:uncharacterized protein LOC117584173 [Drosophila guanche]